MNKCLFFPCARSAIGLFAVFGLGFAASADLRIGQPAPGFTATDINGKTVKLSDYRGKIVVIESYSYLCPRTRLEYNSGAVQSVQHRLATNGVVYLIVDPGTDHLSPAGAKMVWANQKMEITDWIIDGPGVPLTQLYGLKTNGQARVIDKDGVLAYSGAFDDLQNLSSNPLTARNYVLSAVRELLAGSKVSIPRVAIHESPAEAFPAPQIGQPAPDFIATDINGRMFRLSDYKGKIVVLESYNGFGCMFCQVHYVSGSMQELQRELTAKGVVWLLIDFPAGPQTPESIRQELANQKMSVTASVIDNDSGFEIGRKYAMKSTPEAFVIDKNGRLAYQGAVDNFGATFEKEIHATYGGPGTPLASLSTAEILDLRTRTVLSLDPRKARSYIRDAVDALLDGKRVAVPETKPYGCPLFWRYSQEAGE